MCALRLSRISAVVVALLLAGGCQQQSAAPVAPDRARAMLTEVLDGWKSGMTPDDFRKRESPIVVQDLEWQGGAVLLDYEVAGPGQELDANLHLDVHLQLRNADGVTSEKDVIYIVGTDPVETVFRKIF